MRTMMVLGSMMLSAVAAEKNPLEVRLVSEVQTVAAGETFHLGLHLKHPEGYHSYWKHPGIVGLATSVKWSLPEGFKAGEIQWPAPELVKMAAYTAQGYHGEILLIVPVTAPETLTAETVTLEAKVSWMCCSKACHPAHDVPFSITLPVSDRIRIDEEISTLMEETRAKIPKPDPRWEAKAKREGNMIYMEMRPKDASAKRTAEEFGELRFFTLDGQVDSDEPQVVEVQPDGSIRWALPWSEYGPKEPTGLPGVIRASGGWEKDGPEFIEVVAPY